MKIIKTMKKNVHLIEVISKPKRAIGYVYCDRADYECFNIAIYLYNGTPTCKKHITKEIECLNKLY